MNKPVVSWAGPAQAAIAAIGRASEDAEVHKPGARERAIEGFRVAEEQCRLARYWLEDERMAELAVQTKREYSTPTAGGE